MTSVKFFFMSAMISVVLVLSKEDAIEVTTSPMVKETKVHISKPSITVLRKGEGVLYKGEEIKLQCEVPEKLADLQYVWHKDSAPLGISESTYTISSATDSHSGEYSCTAKKGTTTSEKSEGQVLTVKDTPKLNVILTSGWNKAFPGEKVILTCETSDGSTGWIYSWSRNSQSISGDANANTLTISSIEQRHHGSYTCKTELTNRPSSSATSAGYSLSVSDPPKLNVILTSGWNKAFPGEKVILTCKTSDGSTGWIYSWSRNSQSISGDANANTLTISSIEQRHHGSYTCKTELTNRPSSSATSAGYSLSVSDTPKLNVILTSGWNKAFPGEKVILTCETSDGSTGWIYSWSRNSQSISGDANANTLTISSIKQSDDGSYTCKTELTNRPSSTATSAGYSLSVSDTPKLNVNLTSGWNKAFPGEKVILTCETSDGSTGWIYSWSRNSQSISSDANANTLTISSIKQRHHGSYTCKTELTNRPSSSATSAGYSLSVSDTPKLNVNLTSGWNKAFPGEKVILTCETSDGSTGWIYSWSRNSQSISGDANANTLTISSIEQRHHGSYTCKTELTNRPSSSATSAGYSLSVSDPPKLNVNLTSGWNKAFPGEKVILTCKTSDGSTGWIYSWSRNSQSISGDANANTLTISSIEQRHHGSYTCKTELTNRPSSSATSAGYSLSVSDPPKLNVILTSGWNQAFPGEKVILTCKTSDGSTGWIYSWSRDAQSIPAESGKTLTISTIEQSDDGSYTCKTELKNRPRSTATSAGYSLTVSDPPKLNVNLTSGWNKAFPGEEVIFTCETSDGSTGWIYSWSRNSQSISGESGNTLTISSIKQSDHGSYTCKTELTNRPSSTATSAGYSLTVFALPLALLSLETSLSDIMSVEVLTLKCEIKVDEHGWNYTWYKDGVFQTTIVESTYPVKATEDSFKSEYKCIGNRTERPLYSSFSESFKANNIVLKRKVLLAISGCVVCGIFLLIIGCIVLRCTRKTQKQEIMKEDLFFSMKDSKIQTTSPLQEYLTENGPPPNKKECDESVVLLNVAVPVVAEENKEESKETAGFTSFKVEKSPQDKDGSSKECDESTETVPAVKDEIKVEA